jgi:hypothetical protein
MRVWRGPFIDNEAVRDYVRGRVGRFQGHGQEDDDEWAGHQEKASRSCRHSSPCKIPARGVRLSTTDS